MDLGWLDVCLRVQDVRASRAFYEDLGFRRVEGSDEEGWAVVVCEQARIGLFEPAYMADSEFSLNFRGGDVGAVCQAMEANGHRFKKPLTRNAVGASAALLDPDGHAVFLDSEVGEEKKV